MALEKFERTVDLGSDIERCWSVLTDVEELVSWVGILHSAREIERLLAYTAVLESKVGPFNLRADLAIAVEVIEEGTTVVKVFLHISKEEQAERLQARLDEPDKNWKFSSADIAERAHWDRYQQVYEEAIAATSTEHAPWYVVPADRKWYRNLAVATILARTLDGLPMSYPPAEEGLASVVID